jgi:hypothetical protein
MPVTRIENSPSSASAAAGIARSELRIQLDADAGDPADVAYELTTVGVDERS